MKTLPNHLFVHIERGQAILPVGELEFDDSVPGGFSARFRYLSQWIESPLGFALDPLNMPLSTAGGWISTDNKYLKLGVLFDAGPDMWGRRVLRAQTDRPQDEPSEQDVLLMGRGNGVGALLFSRGAELTRAELPGLAGLPSIETDLLRTHQAAHSVFDHSTLEPKSRRQARPS